jgi:hypothetical protein
VVACYVNRSRWREDDTHVGAPTSVTDAISSARVAETKIRDERMRQAKITFDAALSLAIVGVLIVFSGVVVLLLRQDVGAGAITIGVGVVTEGVSAHVQTQP